MSKTAKDNVEYKPVPQERDTYELNLDNWCDQLGAKRDE